MSEPATPHVDVHVGDVSHSNLLIGDYNTIQTPEGTKVTILQVGERPVPRLRRLPLAYRPAVAVEIVGRTEELRLAASAAAGAPLQIYAPDGAGKTALLKSVAQNASAPPEGVVFRAIRRRSLDDIQAELYTAFWECDVPFLPGPAEVGDFLVERQALLVLDDCELDRADLDTLLDSAPGCTVVTACAEQTLWSRGTARSLTGLDPVAAVQLLERQLGRPIEAEERPAAEAVVARLEGHPQSLVETAALIADGRASMRELADDPAALTRRFDPSALTSSQARIVEVLAAVAGAPLGVEHVSALADVSDAGAELAALERRGWVKSASPRFRLARPPPENFAEPSEKLLKRTLDHLTQWSEKARPAEVADDAEAVEASLAQAADADHAKEAVALSLAAERDLAVSGSWTSWRNVLTLGLGAARELEDEAAEAHLLHQLGSRSLCIGAQEQAMTELTRALQIRERIDDHEGAALTRHNLGQIGGGGGNGGANGGGPWPPSLRIVLAALGAIAVAVVVLVLATSGDGDGDGSQDGGTPDTTQPAPGMAPTITIETPADGATFTTDDKLSASYTCTPSEGVELASCDGPVASGAAIEMAPGSHEFTVTARDDAGREAQQTANYTVSEAQPTDTRAALDRDHFPG